MDFLNTSKAYLYALHDVLHHPDYVTAPRGQKVWEKVDYKFRVMAPTAQPIETKDPARNQVIADYLKKEFALYDSCSNQLVDFVQASKFWAKVANPDGTVNSAYGHLIWGQQSLGNTQFEGVMRTPWEWAKLCLIQDKDTRQATLRFSLPQHHWKGNLDQVCTLSGNFLIRDDRLHMTILMRSQDLVKGLVYDMPWFCSLIERMTQDLQPTYPGLRGGIYTHIVHSFHIYQRDVDTVRSMLGEA